MSRFIMILFFSLSILWLNGCSSVAPSAKKFADEDLFILLALQNRSESNFSHSSRIFYELYKNTSNLEYLYNSLDDNLMAKEPDKIIEKISTINNKDDLKLKKFYILALTQKDEYTLAKMEALQLATLTKDEQDYMLLSDICLKLNQKDEAIKYLEEAYTLGYNEEIVDKIATLLFESNPKEAILKLETHSRMVSCSKLICNKLALFYAKENNIDMLLSTYLRLYDKEADPNVAMAIIRLYGYKEDINSLKEFLEKSKADDKVLLMIYAQQQDYAKAYDLATKLYEQKADIELLAQSAIYEYEAAQNKKDKALLDRVASKLQRVLKERDDALYLNYLGYLLIDNDMDIKKGISLVKEALKQDKNSPFYLDSLAWGYYKLKNCQEAKRIIERVLKLEGGEHEEVKEHLRAIDECLKKYKKGKK